MRFRYFNLAGGGAVALHRIPACPNHHIPAIGVAEVYWADLPRDLARRGDTMDESRAWAYTVAGRAKAAYRNNVPVQTLRDRNFARAAGVIQEIAEGVGVLENLTMIAAKAGLFHFDLAALLEQYVGGIQLPADFEFYRDTILARFHGALTRAVTRVMQDAEDGDGPPEIYIFAHSEGTVISFARIMQALLLPQERPEGSAPARMMEWVTHLRGFMTFGSPLDKHILLWPSLWKHSPFIFRSAKPAPSTASATPSATPPSPACRTAPVQAHDRHRNRPAPVPCGRRARGRPAPPRAYSTLRPAERRRYG